MPVAGHGHAGGINFRGRRKLHWGSCGCCFAYDNRDEVLERVAWREAAQEIEGEPEEAPTSGTGSTENGG